MHRDPDPGWRIPAVINPPKRCVKLWIPDEPGHIAAFWGALVQLGYAHNWEWDGNYSGREVSRVWFDVFMKATEDFYHNPCNCPPADGECRHYAATAPFIDYAPQDPRIDPNRVPTGYIRPPWYIVTQANITDFATGVQIGDVLTDLTRFPTGSLPTVIPPDGFARFRVNVQGRQDGGLIEVELHFVKYPLGGMAFISIDGNLNPSTWEFIGLNKDLVSAPPETNTEIIVEKSILGSGKHFIDVTILPFVNDQAPFVYYGGGLRKVVICGADLPAPVAAAESNCSASGGLNDEDLGMAIRFNAEKCQFEQSIDGANWCTIWDGWQDCVQGAISSGSGETGEIPEGGCVSIKRNLDSSKVYRSNYPVKEGYTIEIVKMRGAANDGTGVYRCPTGYWMILGGCDPTSSVTHETGDPSVSMPHMAMIGRIGSLLFPAWEGQSFTVPSTIPNLTDLEFLVNDGSLPDNDGDIYAEITICRPQGVGSGSGIILVGEEADNLTITSLGGLQFQVDAPYNNHPISGEQPLTRIALYAAAAATPETPLHLKWHIDSLIPSPSAATGYSNNGGYYTDGPCADYTVVPDPVEPDWATWWNTNHAEDSVCRIDIRGLAAPLGFSLVVTLTV